VESPRCFNGSTCPLLADLEMFDRYLWNLVWMLFWFRAHPLHTSQSHTLTSNKMADARTCQAGTSQRHLLHRSEIEYRDADKSLARPGRKQPNISVRMAWISFGALHCRGEKNLMTARVSMLLKLRASLACFRACFLPGRAKDLSAPRYISWLTQLLLHKIYV